MCGIAGFTTKNFSENFASDVGKMLLHRGPDFTGYWAGECLTLVHTRLSIIDVSASANQPMHSHGRTVVFNGEIYNFNDIREELIEKGYSFELHSDTEVILKAFDYWNTDCFDRFNGMFAIALVDPKTQRLILARDRYGVKPLYYYLKNGCLLFASELSPFLEASELQCTLNANSLADYLRFGYVTHNNSILEDISKVPPGHFININMDSWKSDTTKFATSITFEIPNDISALMEETKNKVFDGCVSRLISDAPVGLLLSGGYDSSIVSYASSTFNGNLKTFTIGFDSPGLDESLYAEKVSQIIGLENRHRFCDAHDALGLIESLPLVLSEPMADSSIIPTLIISKFASSEVKVVLSADGGDELFAGYEKYSRVLRIWKYINIMPFRRQISRAAVFLLQKSHSRRLKKLAESISSQDPIDVLESVSCIFTLEEIDNLLKMPVRRPRLKRDAEYKSKQDILNVDITNYLCEDILVKVDRASMAFGLEAREPLLDKRLVEYARGIPFELKLTGTGEAKHILKSIVHQLLPERLMRRPKMGFSVPMSSWLRNELRELASSSFDEKFLNKQGIFNSKWLCRFVRDFYAERHDDHEKIWALLMFQIWYRFWFMEPRGRQARPLPS